MDSCYCVVSQALRAWLPSLGPSGKQRPYHSQEASAFAPFVTFCSGVFFIGSSW
jgi:hypothetical protein